MNAAAAIPCKLEVLDSGRSSNDLTVKSLLDQLNHFRSQSEQLFLKNELHSRLAGANDLAGMVEAFSVWLMPLVEHDLVAFKHLDRNRQHIFCSSHGPKRRLGVTLIDRLFKGLGKEPASGPSGKGKVHIYCWPLVSEMGRGNLVLLRSGRGFSRQDGRIVERSLEVLGDTLYRVLGYEELYEQARRDTLTGLDNRRVFEERIGPMIDNAKRHCYPLTLASMDLDRFKCINDTFGHARGDEVLREVADLFAGMVRSSDLLIRMGGDEFLLVLPDTARGAAKKLAQRLCIAVNSLDVTAPGGGRLGISIGLSQWQAGWTKEEWLQRADEALYRAKFSGRSRVCML